MLVKLIQYYYTRNKQILDSWPTKAIEIYRNLVLLEAKKGARILHLGCGYDKNEITRSLANRCKVVGIDFDHEALTKYHSRSVLADIAKMPVVNESFDLICSEYVFEHLKEPKRCFREIKRVLRQGGKSIFLTPNKYSYKSIVAAFLPYCLHIWLSCLRYGKDVSEDVFSDLLSM